MCPELLGRRSSPTAARRGLMNAFRCAIKRCALLGRYPESSRRHSRPQPPELPNSLQVFRVSIRLRRNRTVSLRGGVTVWVAACVCRWCLRAQLLRLHGVAPRRLRCDVSLPDLFRRTCVTRRNVMFRRVRHCCVKQLHAMFSPSTLVAIPPWRRMLGHAFCLAW